MGQMIFSNGFPVRREDSMHVIARSPFMTRMDALFYFLLFSAAAGETPVS